MGVNGLSRVLSSVMLPALSKLKEDKLEVKKIFLKSISILSALLLPIVFGISASANNFIPLLFGVQWIGMVPIIEALTIFAVTTVISSQTSSLFVSQGKVKLQLKIAFYTKFTLLVSILVGIYWGAIGVAYSIGFVSIITNYFMIKNAGKSVNMTYYEYINVIAKPLLISCTMWLCVANIDFLFYHEEVGIRLLLQIILGFTIYISLSYFFNKQIFNFFFV